MRGVTAEGDLRQQRWDPTFSRGDISHKTKVTNKNRQHFKRIK